VTDLSRLTVYTATDGERWIVASTGSPYFCMEADNERDALALAAQALQFYSTAQDRFRQMGPADLPPAFEVRTRVSARELAIAYW
jgi:hypothetical protein